jgi:hypothetical protein
MRFRVRRKRRVAAEQLHFLKDVKMLHPNQYQVNEAWIVFKINDEPIHTELNGDFNFISLMDAASCFILGYVPVAAGSAEPGQNESRELLEQGKSHKNQLPKTLFIPIEQPAQFLEAEAKRMGIDVVRIEEYQLHIFIGEAKEAFREHMVRDGSAGENN